ncbi:MAG: hypothetical protein LBB52_07980 [Desulfovibrio sp.]|jgi:hypothetical protein|nr:hypothetical protein [Desulfovibrio sp.]
MEEATQSFNKVLLLIPALLALIPALLFYAGHRISRTDPSPLAGKSLYWLGGHGITLALVALLTVMSGSVIPDTLIARLPLVITVLYLCFGLALKLPAVFSLGLATPLLWFLLIRAGEAFFVTKYDLYNLPEEPFWYMLAALIVYGMRCLKKPAGFWENAEYSLVLISGCCLMTAIWLMAVGQPSLLSALNLPRHVWALALTLLSAGLLWCARHMSDALFGLCSLIGFASGAYTFISSYPWK